MLKRTMKGIGGGSEKNGNAQSICHLFLEGELGSGSTTTVWSRAHLFSHSYTDVLNSSVPVFAWGL